MFFLTSAFPAYVVLHRSRQTCSRHFRVSARPLYGVSSQASNSSSSIGKQWPRIHIIKHSPKHLTKASKIFISGMAKLAALLQHTLYVLVCSSLFLRPRTNRSLQVLDPNVKDMYFKHWWDTVRYTAGIKQLEDVVCRFLSFIIALGLLTTIMSLTGIILHPCKVWK